MYLRRAGIAAAGILSLPDPTLVNFNPEAFAAKLAAPDRRFVFASLDYSSRLHPALGLSSISLESQTEYLADLGADGLKMWLGKPSFQARVGLRLDSEEVAGVYRAAAARSLPVLIHVADPEIFWAKEGSRFGWTQTNQPDGPEAIPGFSELQRQAEAVLEGNPATTFIFPHLMFRTGDLEGFTEFMRRFPNALLDLSPGLYFYGDLHRRRRQAREFFSEFRSRILFGSDGMWFPPGHDYLPHLTIEENLKKTTRLLDFLQTDKELANPFEHTREELPFVEGLELGQDTMKMILAENFINHVGAAPRKCSGEVIGTYAEEVGRVRRHIAEGKARG